MNSTICRPVTKIGSITIKQNVGGETTEETVFKIESVSAENVTLYKQFPTKELRRYLAVLERKGLYDVKDGIWTKKPDYKDLQIKRLFLRKIIEERVNRWIEIRERKWRRSIKVENWNVEYDVTRYSIPTNLSMINQNFDYEVVNKGGKMKMIEKNQIHKGYVDRFGVYHQNVITKDCLIPYKREQEGIKKKDFLILHRSGRLGVRVPGKIVSTRNFEALQDDDDENLQKFFKIAIDNGYEFFVLLPKGGRRKKEYGEVPMPITPYHRKGSEPVPINQVVRKIYKPEVDGRTPLAKEVIGEYRGSVDGYGPVYTYDEQEHMRDFVPELLSYNSIEYSDKLVIVLGTRKIIDHIDSRIKEANKMKNGFHNFTDQKIIGYNGQESRCKNVRILPVEDGVQVFGLNLKGTPEEDLKGYLRSFSRTPSVRTNEEAKELLEIAHEQDGRQTQQNIEHDLRVALKHLKTKSSQELYYLILGVEDELSNFPEDITILSDIPEYVEMFGRDKFLQELQKWRLFKTNKKEQALINILESFKSTKDIEEHEGKGLTSDIKDLVTIEENSNDASYKKSKNLFSQQMGILTRNQNPLRMKGGFEHLSSWTIKGGPISFPRNEEIPKRNIKFIQRKSPTKRVEAPEAMFSRSFTISPRTEKVKTNKGIKSRMIGIKVESNPLFTSFIQEKELPDWVLVKSPEHKGYPVGFETRNWVLVKSPEHKGYPIGFKKIYTQDWITKHMSISAPNKEYVSSTVSGLKLPTPKKYVLIRRKPYSLSQYLEKPVGMFDRVAICHRRVPLTGREAILLRRGNNKKGDFVRTSHKKPSSFKILHTIGDGEGNIDYYIISINGMKLYAKGNLDVLNNPAGSLSFTGTRTPKEITKKFVKGIVNMFLEDDDYVTISGGAEGCDTIVHSSTLRKGGKTIMVMAGGFNGQFVKKNQIKPETILKRGGLLLSEHPPEYSPKKKDFVLRNKIIASLSERLVVFEAGNGTKHCTEFGVELGKELLVQTIANKKIKLVSRRDYPF